MLTVLTRPGRCFMGRLAKGDDLLQALEKFCQEQNITLGEVRALGAVTRARVGFYNQEERKYYFLDLDQPLEILALVGNISLKDGKPMVHAHVTLADAEGRAWGGHLTEGTPVFACEFALHEYLADKPLARQNDPETGLMLWPK
ncbi:MAG: DNA-binding protein [Deltaproteobacteria bacterium]|nr:DNA-binding protein [Deltaproteobacteria bacterium]